MVRGPRTATFLHQHEPAQVRHVRPGKVVERGPLRTTIKDAVELLEAPDPRRASRAPRQGAAWVDPAWVDPAELGPERRPGLGPRLHDLDVTVVAVGPRFAAVAAHHPAWVALDGARSLEQPRRQQGEDEHGHDGGQPDPGNRIRHHLPPWSSETLCVSFLARRRTRWASASTRMVARRTTARPVSTSSA